MEIEVLKFSAPWCSACKTMDVILRNVDGIKEVNLDIDPDTGHKYKVRSLPTFIFLKDGVEKERITGLFKEKDYDEIINRIRQN